MSIRIPRLPWAVDFPDVVVHGLLGTRDQHPSYSAAKGGDAIAAAYLVRDMLSDEGVEQLRNIIRGQQPFVMPVSAFEVTGYNSIPDAMALAFANRLGLTVLHGTIVQSNRVAHTKANGWHRFVTPAMFAGPVVSGASYLLVDDHVGHGGTLANLRGHIETNGGHVLGMTALTETPGGRQIAIRRETQNMLQNKHGHELDQFWKDHFGYGTDCLTNVEAGYLCRRPSLESIRTRMLEAAESASGRGLSAVRPLGHPSP